MVNLRRLTDQAKKIVDKRGGTDALKEDAGELKDVAKSKGQPDGQSEGRRGGAEGTGAKGEDEAAAEKPAAEKPAE